MNKALKYELIRFAKILNKNNYRIVIVYYIFNDNEKDSFLSTEYVIIEELKNILNDEDNYQIISIMFVPEAYTLGNVIDMNIYNFYPININDKYAIIRLDLGQVV